jgi:hypothetical protein
LKFSGIRSLSLSIPLTVHCGYAALVMTARRTEAWPISPPNLGGLRDALRSISDMPNGRVITVLHEPERIVTFLKDGDWAQERTGENYLIIYEYEEPNA